MRSPSPHRTVAELQPKQIDIAKPYDLQYWGRALGVSHEDLVAAVKSVGPDARAVSRALGRG